MHVRDFLQVAVFLSLLVGLTPVLGLTMARIFTGRLGWFGGWDRMLLRAIGVDATKEMSWQSYAGAVLVFHAVGFVVLLAILLAQHGLPLNPEGLAGLELPLAVNTAVSFLTNTNWQAYSGEAALSAFSQMAGLSVQNFLSAATGIAVLVAVARGFARQGVSTLGSFWVDLTRATVFVLLPLSVILAVVLVSQGVVQNFGPYSTVATVEAGEQTIPLGPAASQIAIKQLGTNGGGFFGVNSAHPFENPTPLSNFFQLLAILLLPAALTITFGEMVGDRRQGWVIFGVMLGLFLGGFALSWWAEAQTSPVTSLEANLEGKELRLGVMNSVLWASATTAASNGSVNAMHDSLSPLAGGVALFNILVGEVIFGGVGCGLYGMLMYVLVTVFLAGLMVGRTPEYLGKKLGLREMRLAILVLLAPSAVLLIGSAVAVRYPPALASLGNAGPHGFSEILYAFGSAAGNNGSAFAGLAVNTPFYNYALALAMGLGRFVCLLPVLAIAGGVAAARTVPASPGTFPTHGVTFGILLAAMILIIGALTHLPALALGPLAEHVLLQRGRVFSLESAVP
jgi:potassium-transporting ATPase potassium-binding subunit